MAKMSWWEVGWKRYVLSLELGRTEESAMAVGPAIIQWCYADVGKQLKWGRGAGRKRSNATNPVAAAGARAGGRKPPLPPIFISTNPSHINLHQLRDLYCSTNTSSHRFPIVGSDGRVEPVDIRKLRTALRHSSVVVSIFCRPQDNNDSTCTAKLSPNPMGLELGDILGRAIPVTPSNGQLVGFGRAVSDQGLTASIYDLMVIPSLRRMGMGRIIVKRIIRILRSRDIFDIAALCSENERLFFQACGFGDDILGSTTMMYTRTISSHPTSDQMVKYAGRSVLVAPSLRQPLTS